MDIKEVEKFLETDEGKALLQKKIDSNISKGISSYKSKFETEELPKLLDSEVKKRFPEMSAEQKRIAELEQKFQSAENASKRAELTAKLVRFAQEKNIPQYLVDISIDKDYDTSLERLNQHYSKFNETLSSEVEKRIEGRKGPIRQQDDSAPIDLNNLPLNDPDFYTKNFDRLEQMLKKSMP